ncbi:5'-nucleotidase C-terminal domain-containing protein [Acidovorax sp. D4N7]|uniref:5'-nucleotidase C-terminal domain-containing protein n=1 Tax=Comamonas endophytica TaxID=2949090 RepID=A0ABY6GA52_9BURK|nr:5'-nucleotidase C-terminal domain-containing protein [Acidovorax sp. 5MLIR]MCD2512169.1 5'-nucleotidase C-terminal domain-containing protein [Acidovorax sp. D4N7]UYG51941.1 5'-nucleotidase C-terminal domain-containing protein [Acidovorax sp. 5MLIR]
MKRVPYVLSLGLIVSAVLTACGGGNGDAVAPGPAPAPTPSPQPMELTILHINDHHSNLDSKSKTLQLRTTAGAAASAVVADAGGFPRVTAAIEALAAQSANVLKLHAGDAQTGTLYFNRAGANGEADAAMMNTVCFDAFTLGNHEFDKGDSSLKGFIDLLHKGACKTPVLSANVNFGANSALLPAKAPGYVNKSTVLQRGGQSIGLVGLTIAGKTKTSSSPDADTRFEDETVAAQREIDALRAQGINKIVVMSHIGYDYDKTVISKLGGVDVVVGADSHTLLGPASLAAYGVGTPAGAYPTQLTNKDGKQVCLVQAWEYSQVVGELKVSFDANGDVTRCAGTPHVLIGDSFTVAGAAATEDQKASILADVNASGFLRVTAPSAAAAAVLKPFKDKIDVFSRSRVATAPQELCSRRVPGGAGTTDYSRSSAACNAQGDVNVHGGDIQQLVAQAYLEVANANYGGADITLQSGGGVRVPLSGNVTAANVIEVLPFGNMLFRLDVTGQEVKSMLEDGMQAVYGPGGTTGPYPYTGGMRFDVNAGLARGSRVSHIEVRDAASGTWNLLDMAKTYRLFVLSFNATGGDGYTTLASVPAARRLDIGVLDADVFQSYIDRQAKDASSGLPVLRKLDKSLYSTRSYVQP